MAICGGKKYDTPTLVSKANGDFLLHKQIFFWMATIASPLTVIFLFRMVYSPPKKKKSSECVCGRTRSTSRMFMIMLAINGLAFEKKISLAGKEWLALKKAWYLYSAQL